MSVYECELVDVSENTFEEVASPPIEITACRDVQFSNNRFSSSAYRVEPVLVEECDRSVLRDNAWSIDGPAGGDGLYLQVQGGSSVVDGCSFEGRPGFRSSGVQLDLRRSLFVRSPVAFDSLATISNCVFARATSAAAIASGGVIQNCVFLDNMIDVQIESQSETTVIACILQNGPDRPNFSRSIPSLALRYCLVDSKDGLFGEGTPGDSIRVMEGDAFFDDMGPEFLFENSGVRVGLAPSSPARDSGPPDPAYDDLDGTRNDLGVYGGPLDVRGEVQP
ncbi:MAG: right-handed parallel beta-helix repeat-containing protein [Candidatus Eisenbacteria bacterium]|uniref:Right-handed parallel beta-helix repeat-containing protein n=1 Tax=Eiseniibacteriota bacterium TaxID=2212470 RepID=A0A956SGM4_UNCEI|nr:right-handed parallel beta-helix repeat-containing protein [Candidatus Eisenbacteria bacterium]